MAKSWYVFRERQIKPDSLQFRGGSSGWGASTEPVVLLSPTYDDSLGDPLGSVDSWMSELDLREWIAQRLSLLSYPPEYTLIPPPRWGFK